ncbi:DUF6712 family protein [uncultured Duncaniella sp.]|uniref:DUF6712 family protein n=1 Tax=uncultured Duncaniella sp. TaxID=2768039 RepID=UPI00339D84C8
MIDKFITKQNFELTCPVAITPDDSIFSAILPAIRQEEAFIISIIGPHVETVLETLEYSPAHPPLNHAECLLRDVVRYIFVAAFYRTLPQLDLVLTTTGFGVVSNNNIAPASADRVGKLRVSLKREMDSAIDGILSSVRYIGEWASSHMAEEWISSIFWRGDHCRIFGMPDATRSDLETLSPEIRKGEMSLRELVSSEFFDEMCANERKGSSTGLWHDAIRLSRSYVYAVSRAPDTISMHRRILIGFLDRNPDIFSTYTESSACSANHFTHYENKKDDSCFFF